MVAREGRASCPARLPRIICPTRQVMCDRPKPRAAAIALCALRTLHLCSSPRRASAQLIMSSDVLPQKNEEYGTKEYWDQRYTQESGDTSFDWFKSYADVADILRELIPGKGARILMLGCGNSKLSEEVRRLLLGRLLHLQTACQMYDDGYKNIVNTDVRFLPTPKVVTLRASPNSPF